MDGTAVKEIERLADENKTVECDGILFARETFKPVMFCPRPDTLRGYTLTGLLDYIKNNREQLMLDQCMIQVESHQSVRLYARFDDEDLKRSCFFQSRIDDDLPEFPFDLFITPEEFCIKARALFVPSNDLDIVIAMASKVVAQNEVITQDDGLSQEIQVRRGVSGAAKDSVETKGIYRLRPYRTFREVEQPEASFILRFKPTENGVPRIALFDAEGGIWRNNAILAIKEYIEKTIVSDVVIPVLA